MKRSQLSWLTSVILAPERLRQETLEFEMSLGYIARPDVRKTNRINQQATDGEVVFQLILITSD
jgi:hypothetical protein